MSRDEAMEWLAGSLQWERTLARLRSGASDEVVAVPREQLTEPVGPKEPDEAPGRSQLPVPEHADQVA